MGSMASIKAEKDGNEFGVARMGGVKLENVFYSVLKEFEVSSNSF
jgi:hypothetical protein